MNLAIFGTSSITSKHIDVIKKHNIRIIGITSLRKNSRNLKSISKKYVIKNFKDWKKLINYSKKYKRCNYLITGRTKDNFRILNKLRNLNCYKLVEKPLFLKNKYFLEFKKDKKIFVGYNRIFYNNVIYLKKKFSKKKNLNVIVKIPEDNKINIISNSCHIISILLFLFGDLKIVYKYKNSKFINIILKGRKNVFVNLFFNFKNSDNFSIEIFEKKNRYQLKPIEQLKIYKGMINKFSKNIRHYMPNLRYVKNENNLDNFKPGFNNQIKEFIKFTKGKRILNNIDFAHKIFKICMKVVK